MTVDLDVRRQALPKLPAIDELKSSWTDGTAAAALVRRVVEELKAQVDALDPRPCVITEIIPRDQAEIIKAHFDEAPGYWAFYHSPEDRRIPENQTGLKIGIDI